VKVWLVIHWISSEPELAGVFSSEEKAREIAKRIEEDISPELKGIERVEIWATYLDKTCGDCKHFKRTTGNRGQCEILAKECKLVVTKYDYDMSCPRFEPK